MASHQATTPSTSATARAGMRRWRESQNAQIANAANATASPNRSGPRQIRKIDGERGPCDDDNLDQKLDSRDQPAEQRRHEAATSIQWILLNVNSTAASADGPIRTSLGVWSWLEAESSC